MIAKFGGESVVTVMSHIRDTSAHSTEKLKTQDTFSREEIVGDL